MNIDLIEQHISVNPEIQHGRPCVKGTRVPVHIVLEQLALGLDNNAIRKEFAPISDEEIRACMLYGAFLSDEQELLRKSA